MVHRQLGPRCVPVVTNDNRCPVVVAPGTTEEEVIALGKWLKRQHPGWTWMIFDSEEHVEAVITRKPQGPGSATAEERLAWREKHLIAEVYRGFSATQNRDVDKIDFKRDDPKTGKRTALIEF